MKHHKHHSAENFAISFGISTDAVKDSIVVGNKPDQHHGQILHGSHDNKEGEKWFLPTSYKGHNPNEKKHHMSSASQAVLAALGFGESDEKKHHAVVAPHHESGTGIAVVDKAVAEK